MEFFEPQDRRSSIPAAVQATVQQGGNTPGSAGTRNIGSADQAAKAAAAAAKANEPELTSDDVKVYLVDPRDERPCLRELSDIYKEHVELQKEAVKRVSVIEKEMDRLLESRMKELSANEMEVWVFDT